MITDYNTFFKVKMPSKGYHCFDSHDEIHIEKNLSFLCACGNDHNCNEAIAHIKFPIENKTLYICPNNKLLLILVRPTGLFKIKGLKMIAAYKAEDENELSQIMKDIESRKRID
ncbi:hypothetical protein FRY74_06315 [Vicingus serpentipes]|uniref:Uncharacterized protein n=1 Tax=Vicingus serpentipes TaxID=1926625 RepID=A0A5C6RVE8_9FLAO|nr:hypothetical protein [Vicingus serpentipes]TXB66183.1 hypothetical protein FRY74_06315 [Vicingus serpentipes]